jgi:hypothetical protein
MKAMGSAMVPYPNYAVTLIGPNSGAGSGVPGVAVRDSVTGRVIDRVAGREDVYSAVAGTGANRLFFLAARSSREEASHRDPEISQVPPGGAFVVRISDAGTVVDLSAVPGVPEPERTSHGPSDLAAAADGSTLAYPVGPPRNWRRPPPVWPVRDFHKEVPGEAQAADFPPAAISIVTVATGERTVWRSGSGGFISDLSLSADGRRMAFAWRGRPDDTGIRVVDLPDIKPGGTITTPSRLVVPDGNTPNNLGQVGMGCLGGTVISADGSTLYVTAARFEAGGQPVTRLVEVSVANGELLRTAYERQGAYPGNIIYGWGPLAIDPSGQHALIAYPGNIARIDLSTGYLTELPMQENGAFDIAW